MSWRAQVFHATSGQFLAAVNARGQTIREAEFNVVSKLALLLRANPAELDVRRLAQTTPAQTEGRQS